MKVVKPTKTIQASRWRILFLILSWFVIVPFGIILLFVPILNILIIITWIGVLVLMCMGLAKPLKIEMYKSHILILTPFHTEIRFNKKTLEIQQNKSSLILRNSSGKNMPISFLWFSKEDILKFFKIHNSYPASKNKFLLNFKRGRKAALSN